MATLNSYRFGAKLDEIPAEHWALLDTCVPYYETDDFIFTHANYLAESADGRAAGVHVAVGAVRSERRSSRTSRARR